jgi:hypothetical protein
MRLNEIGQSLGVEENLEDVVLAQGGSHLAGARSSTVLVLTTPPSILNHYHSPAENISGSAPVCGKRN